MIVRLSGHPLIQDSLSNGEDYATEWAKRQAKLAKQAKEAVRKFNAHSAAAVLGGRGNTLAGLIVIEAWFGGY